MRIVREELMQCCFIWPTIKEYFLSFQQMFVFSQYHPKNKQRTVSPNVAVRYKKQTKLWPNKIRKDKVMKSSFASFSGYMR